MTEWSNLPNAKHIDWVLASLQSDPDNWSAAWSAARSAEWEAAIDAARSAARERLVAYDAAWEAALDAAIDAESWAPPSAILAFIAYDHSVKYLSMTPDKARVWGALSDDPACILLLPMICMLESNENMREQWSELTNLEN